MSTNQAFIKVFRTDDTASAVPMPRREAASAWLSPAWQTSVEVAAANYAMPAPEARRHEPARPLQRPAKPRPASPDSPAEPIIGKRPLSSFSLEHPSMPAATSAFRPETVISAFHWPELCRALWSDYASQYERVADVLLATGRDGRPLVGITGLHTGDGATTTLLGLAVALVARKCRLAVVDANLRAPALAKLLGVEPTVGWADVLEHGLPVTEAMIRGQRDGLDLLPFAAAGRAAARHAVPLASSLQTSVTAGVLRAAYDLVLIDLGSLLEPGSYAAISLLVRNMTIDAALAVASPHTAEADELTIAGQLLEEDGCELLGVVENRAKPQAMDLP